MSGCVVKVVGIPSTWKRGGLEGAETDTYAVGDGVKGGGCQDGPLRDSLGLYSGSTVSIGFITGNLQNEGNKPSSLATNLVAGVAELHRHSSWPPCAARWPGRGCR